MSNYYNLFDDIEKYPDATIIIAYSRRGVGKTYGALLGALERYPIIYVKRTIDDVDLICSSTGAWDMSPYAPINRDHGLNIKPHKIGKIKGIASFSDDDQEDAPIVNYTLAFAAVRHIKGIDLSACGILLFDEFIPQASEMRILQSEGEILLDLYMTVLRDREKRGLPPLKLVLFANAENIYCPIVDELDIIDDLAELAVTGESYKYIEKRGILIHHINEIELEDAEKGGIYKAMEGTKWFRKSFLGEFSKNDFSNVEKKVLKRYVPLMEIIYKEYMFYIYQNNQDYYICKQRSNKCAVHLNLNRDNDIRLFYAKYVLDIQEACMNGHVKFSDYSLYDLIMNYSKRFKNVL